MAETYDIALNAIKKIIVKYKVLKPVLTIKEALKRESYTFPPQTIERGNPLQGISGAKHKLKGKVSCGGQDLTITKVQCDDPGFIELSEILEGGNVVVSLSERALGRVTAADVKNPLSGEIVIINILCSTHSNICIF